MNIQNATLYYTHNKYFKLQIQRIKVLFMKVIDTDSVQYTKEPLYSFMWCNYPRKVVFTTGIENALITIITNNCTKFS